MISLTDVEQLRDRPPTTESPVLSVYLDVDQSRAANLKREFEIALRERLRSLERQLAEPQREMFRTDAARVQSFVSEYQPRAKTLVVFADDSARFFRSGDLHVSLPTDVRWRPAPYVRPLVEALDEHERYGVALVDKERARLFVVFLGEIEQKGEAIAPAEVRHKKASGTDHLRSDMHFQRQDEVHVHWHLRRVAEMMDEVARTNPLERILLAGPVEATSELTRLLPRTLAERVVGTLRMPIEAPASEVLSKTLEVAERAERDAERKRVADLFDRGKLGLEATLEVLQQGRLLLLVYAEGFAARGSECPRCRALSAAAAAAPCAYCGERTVPLDDLLERLVERVSESGAKVEQVRGEPAAHLREKGGIGALLRF